VGEGFPARALEHDRILLNREKEIPKRVPVTRVSGMWLSMPGLGQRLPLPRMPEGRRGIIPNEMAE
jgi:hypothetical protein